MDLKQETAYGVIRAAAIDLRDRFKQRYPCVSTRWDVDKTSFNHLLWMLEQVIHETTLTTPRRNHWLGYVQGVLCARGVLDYASDQFNPDTIEHGVSLPS